MLVYETEPLAEPVEVTGRGDVQLRIASTAVDTDFTAKLIDVYPPNEDYPDGYAMLINDSIIRCRYRNGFEQEELMEPGQEYEVRSCCRRRRTSSPPATGSASTSPRRTSLASSANPNTGEPIGRHTRMVKSPSRPSSAARSCCR